MILAPGSSSIAISDGLKITLSGLTPQSLFDEIRSGAAWVAERSSLVRIDDERLRAYAAELPLSEVANPVLDPGAHFLGRGEDTVAYFVILDAVNFGSGWFPILRKRAAARGTSPSRGASPTGSRRRGRRRRPCLQR